MRIHLRRRMMPWLVFGIGTIGCGDATSPSSTGAAPLKLLPANSLALGTLYTCMLTDVGDSYCWGNNRDGELGTGDTISSTTPRATTGGLRFVQITVGTDFTCAITSAAVAYCWGLGTAGQLGTGGSASTSIPTAVTGGIHFQSIAAGFQFACGLEATTGSAYCWGNNHYGSLGTGDTLSRSIPTRVAGELKFKLLRVGFLDACGIVDTSASDLYCWGWNDGRNISPTPGIVTIATRVVLPTAAPPLDVTVGGSKLCVMYSSGPQYCWGKNYFGELGLGSAVMGIVTTPTPIVGAATLATVTASKENDTFAGSCGLSTTGAAYCWGMDASSLLGVFPPDATNVVRCVSGFTFYLCAGSPVQVASPYSFTVVSIGAEHACGITTAHAVACWGYNRTGQVGNGATVNVDTPTLVLGRLRAP